MLTSSFRNFNCVSGENRIYGFTLIEILVVLLIVTVLVGVTVPRLPGFVDSADLDLEARRLELLLNMARSEAALDYVEFGFDLTDNGYEFVRYDPAVQRWRRQESPYHARELPEGLGLELEVSSSDFDLEAENLPAVLILSSGETTPVSITLRSDGRYHRILKTNGYEPFAWVQDNAD